MKSKLNLNPKSKGERYYQYVINQSQNILWAIIPLIFAIFSFGTYYLGLPDKRNILFPAGFMWILIFVLWFERRFAYKILKRQQDEINKLKEK